MKAVFVGLVLRGASAGRKPTPESAIPEGQYDLDAKFDALVYLIASEFQIPVHRLMGYESPRALAEARARGVR